LPGMSDLFVVIALVVVAILLFYYRQLPRGQWLVRAALGLQLGGALGNLLDRLIRGSVVDFVDVNFWPLREWPVFNVADASIVAGVVFLGISLLREGVVQQRPDEREETIAEKGAL
jgi:signal peptidase II